MIKIKGVIVDIPHAQFEELTDRIVEAIESLGGGLYAVWELIDDVNMTDEVHDET